MVLVELNQVQKVERPCAFRQMSIRSWRARKSRSVAEKEFSDPPNLSRDDSIELKSPAIIFWALGKKKSCISS